MPMFKKGKPDSRDAAGGAGPAAAATVAASPAIERSPHRDPAPAVPRAQDAPAAAPAAHAGPEPAAAVATDPVAALPTPGESLLAGETEKTEAPAAAIDDATTSNLMHIFTEDQESMNANATIYEPFMEKLTMEQVAANARQLLDDLRARG